MSEAVVITDIRDRVMTITMNRPNALNTWNQQLMQGLMSAFDAADENDEVRAIVLTGAGRAFCAGMDLSGVDKTFERVRSTSSEEHEDSGGLFALRVFASRKPVVAAINGPATGVGITMTLPCDIRIASNKAKMGFVFTRRGIAPDGCSSWFAPRIVGQSKAMEWFLSGRVFSADEALAAGLVSELHEPEAVLPRALDIAAELITHTSAVSVAVTRQLLWRMRGVEHPREAFEMESKTLHHMFNGADVKEGIASFLEKRDAQFTMRVSRDFPDFLK